jgi:hypothetical protein
MVPLKIFIGSSKEGLAAAEKVKTLLKPELDATLWNEGVFRSGETVSQILQRSLNYYDFGIFVATADDKLAYRNEIYSATRDNVLYEFGLFDGAKGYNFTFLICDEKVKLPSDLDGVVVLKFNTGAADEDRLSLLSVVNTIRNQILKQQDKVALSKFSSGVLAYEYYINCVSPLAVYLKETLQNYKLGANINKLSLQILISNSIHDHTLAAVDYFFSQSKWKKIICECKGAVFAAYRNLSVPDNRIEFCIIPSSPSAIEAAINMLFPQTYFGNNESKDEVIIREMNNFSRVLTQYIAGDALCQKIVHVTPMHQ